MLDIRTLTTVRVAALLMLECGRQSTIDPAAAVRLLKTCLKVARGCQDNDILPLATKVLERAATYQEELSGSHDDSVISGLRVDYFAARAQLVCINRVN